MKFSILWPFTPYKKNRKAKATWHIVSSTSSSTLSAFLGTRALCGFQGTDLAFFRPKEIIGKENCCKSCEENAKAIGLIRD